MKFTTQSTLNQYILAVNFVKKARLNRKFALALYTTSRAFSSFDNPTQVDFFVELGYATPTQQALAKPLLDLVYKDTKDQVKEIAQDLELGLVTDKSTNVSLNRLANYSFLLPDKCHDADQSLKV